MIRLEVSRNSANTITAFTLSGHANADEYGKDIVCAGVSAVAIGTVNAIAELCASPLITKTEEDGGFLDCQVPDEWEGRTAEDGQLLLEGMLVALYGIQEAYSDFIKIKEYKGGADQC